MGFTKGCSSTLVADAAPPELRGTAFGMFNLVSGVALLAASIIAGALWDMSARQAPSSPAPPSPPSPSSACCSSAGGWSRRGTQLS